MKRIAAIVTVAAAALALAFTFSAVGAQAAGTDTGLTLSTRDAPSCC